MDQHVPTPGVLTSRVISTDEVETVVDILVGSFYSDPVWGWAFPDDDRRRDQHRVLWRMFVEGARRYPWTFLTSGDTATSLWIPPGGTEMTDEQVRQLAPTLRKLLGSGADRVLTVFEVFETAHPHDVPHVHLSLLGTDPAHLGHGYGLGLLEENLRAVDALGVPAYLEASNVGNVALYARYGFVAKDTVRLPDGGPEFVTMWREAAGHRPR